METIFHNTDKNGIEISFDYHITDETKAWFRANTFRWSKRSNHWWRPFSEEMWIKVHEFFKQGDSPPIKPNTTCDICGKLVKKYGMGGHKLKAHGISIKRIVTTISKQGETYQRVLRPSAYVPVMATEQTIRAEKAPEQTIKQPATDLIGKVQCYQCNGWFNKEDTNPTYDKITSVWIPTTCLDCYYKSRPVAEVKKTINPLAPGMSVVSERSWWIWTEQCKCKDYSIEKHNELGKIYDSH